MFKRVPPTHFYTRFTSVNTLFFYKMCIFPNYLLYGFHTIDLLYIWPTIKLLHTPGSNLITLHTLHLQYWGPGKKGTLFKKNGGEKTKVDLGECLIFEATIIRAPGRCAYSWWYDIRDINSTTSAYSIMRCHAIIYQNYIISCLFSSLT